MSGFEVGGVWVGHDDDCGIVLIGKISRTICDMKLGPP